jgi:hypothetical protein
MLHMVNAMIFFISYMLASTLYGNACLKARIGLFVWLLIIIVDNMVSMWRCGPIFEME